VAEQIALCTSVIFIKLFKVNNHPTGDNSPKVTLAVAEVIEENMVARFFSVQTGKNIPNATKCTKLTYVHQMALKYSICT
jgi:hypothetical protein